MNIRDLRFPAGAPKRVRVLAGAAGTGRYEVWALGGGLRNLLARYDSPALATEQARFTALQEGCHAYALDRISGDVLWFSWEDEQ